MVFVMVAGHLGISMTNDSIFSFAVKANTPSHFRDFSRLECPFYA